MNTDALSLFAGLPVYAVDPDDTDAETVVAQILEHLRSGVVIVNSATMEQRRREQAERLAEELRKTYDVKITPPEDSATFLGFPKSGVPLAVATQPQDWAPLARRMIWPNQ